VYSSCWWFCKSLRLEGHNRDQNDRLNISNDNWIIAVGNKDD
jgi:hypothetical protein